mgnify:CR=1 FL=1
MAITKPQLPPKAGYVEVEVDGKRVYKQIENNPTMQERLEALEAAMLFIMEKEQ